MSRPPASFSLAERFWFHVMRTDGCWLWNAATSKGYGVIRVDGRNVLAHRLAYELTYGLLLPGLCVCHHCDVKACVRPEHLFLGTHTDNMRDMSRKHGHPSTVHIASRPRGEAQYCAKLTEVQVREIRRLYSQEQCPIIEMSRRYRVTRRTIQTIVRNQGWRHLL